MGYKRLFEPGQMGQMQLKNRIVMAPMATSAVSDTGGVTQWQIDYYVERAKGGVGLIITEAAQVDWPRGTHGNLQLRIDDDRFIAGLSRLAEAVHRHGAKVAVQLHHAGGFSLRELPGAVESVAPSAIVYGRLKQVRARRELEIHEIEEIVEKFVCAAERAKKAGFDAAELHGGHQYLLAQFMSPLANKRTDEYGGSLKRRMKFPMEVLACMKSRVGDDYPIIFRMNGAEFVEGGLTLEDSKIIAPMLENVGADALDITAGSPSLEGPAVVPVSVEPMSYPEGWKVYLAQGIKTVVDIPIIAVGVIRDPGFAEEILEQRQADFVAIGRGLLSDPYWPTKAAEGRVEDIRKCISCNECAGARSRYTVVHCALNVAMNREEDFSAIRPATVGKRVLVIGGGPAGMEAARIASKRGHRVTLFEEEDRLGGQLMIASVPPFKAKLKWFRDYLVGQVQKSGVEIVLGKKATSELVKEFDPEVLIVATGSEPLIPKIPGADNREIAITAHHLLEAGEEIEGLRVVVMGGGMVGCETASYLADRSCQVTVVEILDDVATDLDPISRFDLLRRLRELGVEIKLERKVLEIQEKGVLVADREGERELIAADKVVMAVGMVARSSLARELEGRVPELHVVGDSREPHRIMEAVYEGSWVGRLI